MIYILLTWLLAPIWWPVALVRGVGTPRPKRILIAEIAGIGDVVCSASLFQAIRDQYPEATIDLLVDPIASSLAPLLPMVNQVRLFAYPEQKGLKGRLRLARIVATYDMAICLIPSAAQLSAFCWGAVPRRLSVLPARLTASYSLLAPLMTRVQRHIDGQYFPGTQFALCRKIASPTTSNTKKIRVIMRHSVNKLTDEYLWVGLLISSGRALKRLSVNQLVQIVHALTNIKTSKPVGVVLLGGPCDKEQAAQVRLIASAQRENNLVVDTVGQHSLSELPQVLRQLNVFVGVDSGVTHMADALEVPVVCIAGPVDLNEVYQPSATRQLFKSDLSCYPCSTVFKTPNKCHLSERRCLDQLDTQALMSQVIVLLEEARG